MLRFFDPPDRTLRVIARHNCELVNISALSRALGQGRASVKRDLRRLVRGRWLRCLSSLPPPHCRETILTDRLFINPKVWKHLLGAEPRKLKAGYQRELMAMQMIPEMIEKLIRIELYGKDPLPGAYRRRSRIYSMGCYRGRGIDLVIERRGGFRIGFIFEPRSQSPDYTRALEQMSKALEQGWINRGFLITSRQLMHEHRCGAILLPPAVLLAYYDTWTGYSGAAVPRAMMRLYRRRLRSCLRIWYPGEPLEDSIDLERHTVPEEEKDSACRLARRIIQLLPRPP